MEISMQDVYYTILEIYSHGKKGKDAGWGRKKSQATLKASADPTGSSEAGEALRNYPFLQQKQWAFFTENSSDAQKVEPQNVIPDLAEETLSSLGQFPEKAKSVSSH